MQLSKNFTLDELTHSEVALRNGWDNTPPPAVVDNLVRLAKFLEQVRKVTGPLVINSAYRCKLVNDSVGSKETSQHRMGCAADIKSSTYSPRDIMKMVIDSEIQYDQMILEYNSWVHISIPNNANETPRGQTLIIDNAGIRPYATNT